MDGIECVVETSSLLGEGPVWCERERLLYWVDGLAPAIHCFNPCTGVDTVLDVALPGPIGCLALRESHGLLLALQDGFYVLGAETDNLSKLHDPEEHLPQNRFNDGKCDARGRFWVGSLHCEETLPTGNFYRFDPDRSCHRVDSGFVVPNGIDWSPDSRTLYLADTMASCILAYEFDLEHGTVGARRVFARIDPSRGYPDGLTVDAEGFLWCAHWEGSRLTRFTADGRVDRVVELPVRCPTSCVFGGEGLDALFVTSASMTLEVARRGTTLDGSLLRLDVGVRGRLASRFAG